MKTREIKFKQILVESYYALYAIKRPTPAQKYALRQLKSFLDRIYPNLLG